MKVTPITKAFLSLLFITILISLLLLIYNSNSRKRIGEPLQNFSKQSIQNRIDNKYFEIHFYKDNDLQRVPHYPSSSGPLGSLLYSRDIDPLAKNWNVGYPLCTDSIITAESLVASVAQKVGNPESLSVVDKVDSKYFYQISIYLPKENSGYTSRIGKCNILDQTKFVGCDYDKDYKLNCKQNSNYLNTYVGNFTFRPMNLNSIHDAIEYLAASHFINGIVINSYAKDLKDYYQHIISSVAQPIDLGMTPGANFTPTIQELKFTINKSTGDIYLTSTEIKSQ